MGDLITFAPRPKPAAPPPAPEILTGSDPALRARIEAAAEVAVDTAQRLIAILDRMDGCSDDEEGGDAEPSLGAPEGHDSQVVWLRGGDEDREEGAAEAMLPEVAVTGPPLAAVIPLPPLAWRGRGNVVAAAGVALLKLVGA